VIDHGTTADETHAAQPPGYPPGRSGQTEAMRTPDAIVIGSRGFGRVRMTAG